MEEINLWIVIAQVINFLIMFWIFNKFVAHPLSNEIAARNAHINKLKKADEEYANLLSNAEDKKNQILAEANMQKEKILDNAQQLASTQQANIIQQANEKANWIISKAQKDAEKLKSDLDSQFETSVKTTTKMVVNKIFETDKNLKDEYIWTILKDIK